MLLLITLSDLHSSTEHLSWLNILRNANYSDRMSCMRYFDGCIWTEGLFKVINFAVTQALKCARYRTLEIANIHCVPKKEATWCLIITLANMNRYSKFFHQLVREKILYVHTTKISTSTAICCYTTLWNWKIQKCYRIFTLNVTICLTKIYCEILCNLPHKYCANDFYLNMCTTQWSIA